MARETQLHLQLDPATLLRRAISAGRPTAPVLTNARPDVQRVVGNCAAGDGRDQRIWFFVGGRFVGNDVPTSSKEVVGIWRDGNTIAFLYVLYRQNDSSCCPTGGG